MFLFFPFDVFHLAIHLSFSGIEDIFSLCMHSNISKYAVRRLADDCSKYGANNQNSCPPLATAVLNFSTSHSSIEDKREALLGILGDQVNEKILVRLHTSYLFYYLYTNVVLFFCESYVHRFKCLYAQISIWFINI